MTTAEIRTLPGIPSGTRLDAASARRQFSKWKKRPGVVLMLTSECNAGCRHCYIPYKGTFDPEEAKRAIRMLKAQGFEAVLSGSETLTDPRYLACYREARQPYILSNGILLAKETGLFDEMRENGVQEVCLSCNFELSPELGSVSEEVVRKAASISRQKGFGIQISTLVTSDNFTRVLEYCAAAESMHALGIGFYRYMVIGNAALERAKVLTPEQEARFFSLIDEARSHYPKSKLLISLKAGFGPKPGSRGEPLSADNQFCPAGVMLFAVTPDRRVYGCPFTIGEGKEVGNLSEEGLMIFRDISNGNRRTCLALNPEPL